MSNKLESAVIPTLALVVGEKSYTVEFPLAAVVQAEEKTGTSLKEFSSWLHLPIKHIPAVLEAGLSKHHPDVTPEEIQSICDRLNPEALDEVHYALCKLAFPRRMELLEEAQKKPIPNVQSGDAQ